MTEQSFTFQVHHRDGGARAGEFTTPHGSVTTPVFMPVATQATIKTLTPEEVREVGAQIVLGNAYHLYLRPGVATVDRLGGLHRFMGWHRPILTDSGGFQAFSMGAFRRVDDDHIRFRSHIDGSEHIFTPELAIANQQGLGADIIMCLDQCIAYGAERERSGAGHGRAPTAGPKPATPLITNLRPRTMPTTPRARLCLALCRGALLPTCGKGLPSLLHPSPSPVLPLAVWRWEKTRHRCTRPPSRLPNCCRPTNPAT